MRVAALYDIHGNLPALEAVLREIREVDVDLILVGGDVVPGPMPERVLTSLFELDIPTKFILGNGEVAVLQQLAGQEPQAVPEQHRGLIRWTADRLRSKERVLSGWPKWLRLDISPLGTVLFCHATPRDDNEIFTRLTSEERLRPIFDSVDAAVVVCGHTHMQFDRRVGTTRVVNAGSVGMPFGSPGADWLLLGPDIELRHTGYDLQQAARRIHATSYPEAREFAARYVLAPPSEDEMLKAFTKSEVS
jgi:predicted phosphodiesterase